MKLQNFIRSLNRGEGLARPVTDRPTALVMKLSDLTRKLLKKPINSMQNSVYYT